MRHVHDWHGGGPEVCGTCYAVKPEPRLPKRTQVDRLVSYLRENPGATGLEIVRALAMPKYTSRVSDARAQGYSVVCIKRKDGNKGYVVVL